MYNLTHLIVEFSKIHKNNSLRKLAQAISLVGLKSSSNFDLSLKNCFLKFLAYRKDEEQPNANPNPKSATEN